MSTLTSLFGMLPLLLMPGAGTELYRGVGAIVMFGVLGTAIVALTFLPALSILVLGWSRPALTAAGRSVAGEGQSKDALDHPVAVPVRKTGTD